VELVARHIHIDWLVHFVRDRSNRRELQRRGKRRTREKNGRSGRNDSGEKRELDASMLARDPSIVSA
jgi:hypothetical protein